MAAPVKTDVTFSVSINLLNKDKEITSTVVKNAVRKFRTSDTWFDVFDICTSDIDELPNDVVDHFEKYAQVFRVRKCLVATCCTPVRNPTREIPQFLPDPEINPDDRDHFEPFSDILGKETSERDMPSGQTTPVAKVAEEQQGCPNRILVAQNVRFTVNCGECGKPRCIFSKKSLTMREERALRRLLEIFTYTCESVITPDGDGLQGCVFVRLQMCCTTPIEAAYYSASHIKLKDVCCYCANEDAERDANALKTHRVVLPICKNCLDSGKDVIKRIPKKN